MKFHTPKNLDGIPGLKCACFTREGGVSPAPYNSLNTGFSSGDELSNVTENIARMCSALDIEPSQLVGVSLVHGDGILIVKNPEDIKGSLTETGRHEFPEADGVISSVIGHYLIMSNADCPLVIAVAPSQKIVGIFHAGWRGVLNKVTVKGLMKMVSEFSIRKEDIKISITPSVGPCCYKIKNPVQKSMPEWKKYLVEIEGSDGVASFDMRQALYDQILEEGFTPEQIFIDRTCTSCNRDLYYSYSAEKPRTGRMPTVVGFME